MRLPLSFPDPLYSLVLFLLSSPLQPGLQVRQFSKTVVALKCFEPTTENQVPSAHPAKGNLIDKDQNVFTSRWAFGVSVSMSTVFWFHPFLYFPTSPSVCRPASISPHVLVTLNVSSLRLFPSVHHFELKVWLLKNIFSFPLCSKISRWERVTWEGMESFLTTLHFFLLCVFGGYIFCFVLFTFWSAVLFLSKPSFLTNLCYL